MVTGLVRKVKGLLKRFAKLRLSVAFYLYNTCITSVPGYTFRRLLFSRLIDGPIHRSTAIHMGVFVTGNHIVIGKNTVVNRRCYLDGRGELVIGENVSISPEVYILTASHELDDANFTAVVEPVEIEDYVWIGARALILPGVTLGRGSVVGAGSVVTKSVEPFTIVAGNPARKIGERSPDLSYQLRYFPYFNTDIGGT